MGVQHLLGLNCGLELQYSQTRTPQWVSIRVLKFSIPAV